MKRYSNLYSSITLKDFIDIYNKQIKVNTKNKEKLKKFEDFYSINIVKAYNLIKNKNYNPSKYNIFLIRKPKYRIIMSQSITDKLINHVISNKILLPVLDKTLIDNNIATRKNKGTHLGIKLLKKYLNELKDKKIYALKFDIKKFFYNIDHDILINLLKEKIKDKEAINILIKILISTDEDYINKNISKIKKNEIKRINNLKIKEKEKQRLIKEIKRIPLCKKGKSLPIGNMTSQIMAIYCLNKLDHFIKEKLHIKYYIRYMDDGLLLSNNKKYLKYCLSTLSEELKKYKLEFNNKTKIININKEGIDFLGFHFYIKNKVFIKVRNDCKKRFKNKIKYIRNNKPINASSIIKSYEGHFKWGNCYKLYTKNVKMFIVSTK